MTVEELRVFINSVANRDQTGNSVKPIEFNSYLARANEDKFRQETGIREVETPIFFESNQISTDALDPFMESVPLTGVAGVFTKPANYRHASAMSHVLNGKTRIITRVNHDQFEAKKADEVSPPTEEYPYATQRQNKIIVSPNTVNQITFDYIRRPAIPVWAYTVVNDEPVYDSANSVQLEWNDIYHIDIARIICSYLGIQFRDADFFQYNEQVKAKGV